MSTAALMGVSHSADAPTPKMTAISNRALFIPPAILALEATLTAKLVLADVLDLHKVSGHVFARDEYFAERLGVSKRSIGDALLWLDQQGFVARLVDHTRQNKRVLVPTALALAFLEKSMQNLHEVNANSASPPESSTDSELSDGKICMESLQNLHGVHANFADINTTVNTTINSGEREAADAAARAEKKIEEVELDNSESEGLPAPAASLRPASHTGGAPANLEPDELPVRPVVIDDDLPDTEWGRWAKIPRDAEMVDDYLRRLHSPHAGKGHLFFDYYRSVGWVIGKNRQPCQFWKSLVKSFRFIDPNPTPELTGASSVQKARNGVEEARELMRRKREGGLGNG